MNPSTSLARAVVDGLIAGGVRHAVLAPGSRSAPLAYELQAADRAGRLTLHVRVDERAAGFLALGLGKVTRTPAAVVTTSGTAVANLHPAVLEAHHGLVPLIVLSADRPRELRGIGANQTTTQPGMFGEAVRFEAELTAEDDIVDRRRVIDRAIRAACVGDDTALGDDQAGATADLELAGPVHLNIALRDPLVPDLGEPMRAEWPTASPPAVLERGGEGPVPLTLPERTLVILGDLPRADDAHRLATLFGRLGLPVIAEPFGQHPLGPTVIAHGPLLLGTTWFSEQPTERIVVAGRVTLSRSVRAALTEDPARVTYLRVGPRWLGPSYPVDETIAAGAGRVVPVIAAGADPAEWLQHWRAASNAVAEAISPSLEWGTGPGLATRLVSALPQGSTLVVGSSNSVRDLELGVDWPSADVTVVANRGLAGIDGVVSTAAGVALSTDRPTYALVGDLTFLHDVNALLIGPHEPRPDLTVVVVNDDGGGIFSTLEPGEAERAADFERIFGTATGARLEDLARAYGIGYARAGSAAQLTTLVGERPSGLRIVEVPVDRGRHRPLRERLRVLAESATAGINQAAT